MARKQKRPDLKHCKVRFSNHPKAPWRVSYKVERDGRTVSLRKTFSNEDAAWNFAEGKNTDILNHGVRYGDIPPEARRAFDFYRDERSALENIGAYVPKIEDLITTALASIRSAHVAKEENTLTIAEAVAVFIEYKQTRVGDRQLADLKIRLRRFAQDLGTRSMPSITAGELDSWLSALRSHKSLLNQLQPLISALSRNHYRSAIHALFKYAAAPSRSWCLRNPVADLEPEKFEKKEPQAYSPEDSKKLMQTALDHVPELVPILALGLFCGLRSSEAANLDLGKLLEKEDGFRTTGKTGARIAPYCTTAKAWIASQPRRSGMGWEKSQRNLAASFKKLFKLSQVEQIHNGARHSFITYRTAKTRDVARVADECGNSVGTIKNHYRKLVSEEAAEKFFAIRPEAEAQNVTTIHDGRASA